MGSEALLTFSMGFLFTIMENNKSLFYDENVSLEVFESYSNDCGIKMYYNNLSDGHIVILLNKEQLRSLISELIIIEKL